MVDCSEAIPRKAVVEETKKADTNSGSSINDRAPQMPAIQTLDQQEAGDKARIMRVEHIICSSGQDNSHYSI